MHQPNLSAIQKLTNKEVQFYAAIGAVVSLTAALELLLLEIFIKGSGWARRLAASFFFEKVRNTSTKRDMALAAMKHYLRHNEPLLAEWNKLSDRIVNATSNQSPRNLVSHNPASRTFHGGSMAGASPLGSGPLGSAPEEQYFVSLPAEVVALKRAPTRADINDLIRAAASVSQLIEDLKQFLRSVGDAEGAPGTPNRDPHATQR